MCICIYECLHVLCLGAMLLSNPNLQGLSVREIQDVLIKGRADFIISFAEVHAKWNLR